MHDTIKTHLFDTEQALTFAREAIDENDQEALTTALRTAHRELGHALDELQHAQPGEH